jgi:hypothetical protein
MFQLTCSVIHPCTHGWRVRVSLGGTHAFSSTGQEENTRLSRERPCFDYKGSLACTEVVGV